MGPARPGAEVDPDLQFLRNILQNSVNPPDVRKGAAERIVARGSTDARRIIDEALRSGDPGQIDAVVTAIDDESRRAGALLDALMAALATSPQQLHPKITRLLSREGDAAVERVTAVGLDAARPVPERLGAIFAMGQLRGRDQAADLMTLLEESRRESAEVVTEACESLERATGQRLGANADAWRQWWAARRTTPSMEFVVASLKEQIAQMQTQLDLESERSRKMVARLRQANLDLVLSLPVAERADRISAFFDDELSEVRLMGLGQVERMLRNGERPPDALIGRVFERLTDRVPSIRTRSMRLLDDLAAPKLSDRVAEILPAESDVATAEAMLRLLASRPSAVGYGAAAARLREPALAEAAALAVNRISDAGFAPSGWESDVVEPARRALAQKPTPEVLRLLGTAGNDADRDAVALYLADEDPALRLGAAEGLRRAGRRRALVERAVADPIIYPVAMASIADQPATPLVVTALVELPPGSENAEAWNRSMSRVLAGLAPKEVLAADATLAQLAFVAPKTRVDALSAALAAPPNGSDPSMRIELLVRLADLHLANGDTRNVLRLLTDEPHRDSVEVRSRLFRAAVLEGGYELAVQLEPAAETWLVLLEALSQNSPGPARMLADEINQRFGRSMSEAERSRLASLVRSLPKTGEG